jgi:two-component system, NtrC family, C4-dicarboxylate transport sensor histidine kinase DctB
MSTLKPDCWRWLAGLMMGLLVIGAFLLGDALARRQAVAALGRDVGTASQLLAGSLARELEQYRLAALVLAQDAGAVEVLSGPRGFPVQALNRKLESLSTEMGAAAIYLLDTDGTTVAASNWRTAGSFIGRNYQFRAYFSQALLNGSHEQFALGTTTRRPGLYVARRLTQGGKAIGVIVAKVELDALETEWRAARLTAFATNDKGVILVTSVPDWRFKTIAPLDQAAQSRMLNALDYGTAPLSVLAPYASASVHRANARQAGSGSHIEAVTAMASGWQLHVLGDTRAAVDPALAASRLRLVSGLLVLLLAMIGYVFWRRANAYRTERVLAEQQRALNDRLVQLNKLAALGQIAAGIGHEINQPLAAITAYASNGRDFLRRGDQATAADNLDRIATLAARIGAITSALRGFARKATGTMEVVSLAQVVQGALLLLRDRIATCGARVIVPQTDIAVHAEAVRLEQVLVNLIANALEAKPDGVVITLSAEHCDGFVELTVADTGPGLGKDARATLFQPFSTSKRDGLGLGLVISRDIMIDFGGELTALNPASGAAFVVRLRPAS